MLNLLKTIFQNVITLVLGTICMILTMIVKFLPAWIALAIIVVVPILLYKHIGIVATIITSIILIVIVLSILLFLINHFAKH